MEFIHYANQIVLYNEREKILAEVSFPALEGDTVEVDHTFVDDSLRGQGVAGKLMQEVVDDLRKTSRKARLTCSYAVAWFEKHPECADVLAG